MCSTSPDGTSNHSNSNRLFDHVDASIKAIAPSILPVHRERELADIQMWGTAARSLALAIDCKITEPPSSYPGVQKSINDSASFAYFASLGAKSGSTWSSKD